MFPSSEWFTRRSERIWYDLSRKQHVLLQAHRRIHGHYGRGCRQLYQSVTMEETPHPLSCIAACCATLMHVCFSTSALRRSRIKHNASCKHEGMLKHTHAAYKNSCTYTLSTLAKLLAKTVYRAVCVPLSEKPISSL